MTALAAFDVFCGAEKVTCHYLFKYELDIVLEHSHY